MHYNDIRVFPPIFYPSDNFAEHNNGHKLPGADVCKAEKTTPVQIRSGCTGFRPDKRVQRPDKALRRRQRQAKIWLFSYLRFRFIKEPRAKRPGLLHHNCQSKWFSAMYFHNAQACNDWIMPFSLSSQVLAYLGCWVWLTLAIRN